MSHEPIPKFASEEEEAAWWDAHPEVLTERFQTAKQQGKVRRLSQTNLPGASETVTIRIPPEELTEGVAALLESLDEAEFGERTAEQEKKDYARRVKQAKSASIAKYKGTEIREPQRELGVVAMLAQLLAIEPDMLTFACWTGTTQPVSTSWLGTAQ